MSLNFKLYELKNFPEAHMELDKVWGIADNDANIIVSWLYNNYISRNEHDYTIMYQISSYVLYDLLQSIKEVLSHDKHCIDFMVSFLLHFTLYQSIPDGPFHIGEDFIYKILILYKEKIEELIFSENGLLLDKEFMYQIW